MAFKGMRQCTHCNWCCLTNAVHVRFPNCASIFLSLRLPLRLKIPFEPLHNSQLCVVCSCFAPKWLTALDFRWCFVSRERKRSRSDIFPLPARLLCKSKAKRKPKKVFRLSLPLAATHTQGFPVRGRLIRPVTVSGCVDMIHFRGLMITSDVWRNYFRYKNEINRWEIYHSASAFHLVHSPRRSPSK